MKLKDRFALERAILVSDRGMVTHANLAALGAENIDWITALKAPQVKKLATSGVLPLSLFEQQNLAQITTDDYPGERLVICRNPLVADERGRKREALLVATAAALTPISVRVAAGTLQGSAEIGLAVGAVINKFTRECRVFHATTPNISMVSRFCFSPMNFAMEACSRLFKRKSGSVFRSAPEIGRAHV